MSRLFYHTCQDNAGNLLFDVSGTMRIAGSGTLATIYGDEALTVILPNPMTNHPSFASFKCFLGSGDYDFYLSKSGYTFETLTGVQGHGTMAQQDAHNVAITGGIASNLSEVSVVGPVSGEIYQVADRPGDGVTGFYSTINGAGGTNRYALNCTGSAPVYLNGNVGIKTLPDVNALHVNGSLYAVTTVQTGGNVGIKAPPDGVNALIVNGSLYAATTVQTGGNVGIKAPADGTHALIVNGLLYTVDGLGIATAPTTGAKLVMKHAKSSSQHGIIIQPSDTDAGVVSELLLLNLAGTSVGGISTTSTTTTYATSSDARLKHDVAPLAGALDVVRRLNPVSFLWNADGSPGRGLLAGEVQEVIPDGVITGERGAIDDDGRIVPQMIDYSKLVPYLVGAVKELTQQVEMLQAQLAAVGA